MKQATVSSFPVTAVSTASWRRLLLLLVPVRPAGGSVYLCWVSGGGREDGGSGSILGVVGGFIFFLSIIVGDGTRFGFLRPCERGEILCIHGDVLFVRVAALVTDARTVGLLASDGVGGGGLLCLFLSLRVGGRFSFKVYDACWRVQALALVA